MLKNLINPRGDMNLHTHTCYCDGRDAPEDMIKQAVSLGFRTLGFSGHGYCSHDTDACMTVDGEAEYYHEIRRLREKYRDVIDVRLGMERDYFNENHFFTYEYEIGSVHYIEKEGEYICVDNTAEIMEKGIEEHFGGSVRAYVEHYYETVSDVLNKTGADIVGHIDLVKKFNRGYRYFDEDAGWYRECAIEAVRRIAAQDTAPREAVRDLIGGGPRPVFEINMGGMAKGYTDQPYPAQFLVEEIDRLGCGILLSSDCHDRTKMNYQFSEYREKYGRV